MGISKNNERISLNDDVLKGEVFKHTVCCCKFCSPKESEDYKTSGNVVQETDRCQRKRCWCKFCNPWKVGRWQYCRVHGDSDMTKKDGATPTSHNDSDSSRSIRCWCPLCDPNHPEAAPEVDYCQRDRCWCSFCNPWKAGPWLYSNNMGQGVQDSSQPIRCWCKFCFPRTDKDGEPASKNNVLEVDICQRNPCWCKFCNPWKAGPWQSTDKNRSTHYCSRYCDIKRSKNGEYTCNLTNEINDWVTYINYQQEWCFFWKSLFK